MYWDSYTVCMLLFVLVSLPILVFAAFSLSENEKGSPICKTGEECNLGYYDVRAGKCPFADVYHGRIFCKNPHCQDYNEKSGT